LHACERWHWFLIMTEEAGELNDHWA